MVGRCAWITALLVAAAGAAHAEAPVTFVHACAGPGPRCGVQIAMRDGKAVHPGLAPIDVGFLKPSDIQAAYGIDPTRGDGVTVATVDAYSYPALESDLAMYRDRYGLPPCTSDSGCLRILNAKGDPSPLPTGTDDGWNAETALDVDMISAACPRCKIVVILTDANKLDVGNRTAAALAVDAISDSWGSTENGTELSREASFLHPGIGTFAASGDDAYNQGGDGPEYPATSQFVVAVGGTKLKKTATGYVETAWSGAGSSCSMNIDRPSYQPEAAGCDRRASSDLSAVADPNNGVAIYNAAQGGFLNVGGTSAATPVVAALMAGAGHGDLAPAFPYRHPEAFHDVVTGSNGTCGTALCNAGSGWDGPTGIGTPDQAALIAIGGGTGPSVTIASPAAGSTQDPGFTFSVEPGPNTAYVDLLVDGVRRVTAGAPYALTTPDDLTDGMHTFEIRAFDADHDQQSTQVTLNVDSGCSAGGGSGGIIVGLLGVALVTTRRRRRIFPLGM